MKKILSGFLVISVLTFIGCTPRAEEKAAVVESTQQEPVVSEKSTQLTDAVRIKSTQDSIVAADKEKTKQESILALARKAKADSILKIKKAEIQKQQEQKAAAQLPVGLEVGEVAPDINLPTPDGKNLALSSLRGKIVLIDFWASWCGPCRRENPTVVSAYNNYKNAKSDKAKGFTVFSVSLDKEKQSWVNAISQDNLEWSNHVSDLKWWYSDAAQKYSVQSIPTNWLLDEKGVIIAKNLRGTMLENELGKIFKK